MFAWYLSPNVACSGHSAHTTCCKFGTYILGSSAALGASKKSASRLMSLDTLFDVAYRSQIDAARQLGLHPMLKHLRNEIHHQSNSDPARSHKLQGAWLDTTGLPEGVSPRCSETSREAVLAFHLSPPALRASTVFQKLLDAFPPAVHFTPDEGQWVPRDPVYSDSLFGDTSFTALQCYEM
jgi:hypothetical protein